jgi:hypothetical protein
MVEHGLDPEDLLGRRFGHHLNFWSSPSGPDPAGRSGRRPQLVLELRPAHDPTKALGVGRGGDRASRTCRVDLPRAPRRRPLGGPPGHHIPAEPAAPSCSPGPAALGGGAPWSATSTCRWTTAGCLGRAGAPASSNKTTWPTPSTARPARSVWAASPAARPPGRPRPAPGRRPRSWSRSAALDADTDRGGMAPTPASSPTATPSTAYGSTRPAARAAMPPATPPATPADHASPGPSRRRAGAGPAPPAHRERTQPGHRRQPGAARRVPLGAWLARNRGNGAS